MAGHIRKTVWRKRRTGHWCSMGQGSGKTIPDGTGDEYDDEDESDDDDGDQGVAQDDLKKANNEAKRRRLENKVLKVQLAVRDAMDDLDLTTKQKKFIRRTFDPSTIKFESGQPVGVDDAVKALVDEFNSDFGSDDMPKNLPPQGSKGNINRNKTNQPDQRRLAEKYPALRHARGRV